MKPCTPTTAFLSMASFLCCAHLALGQGTVNFINRVTTGSGAQGPVIAPVYGPDPADPSLAKTGNTSAGYPPGNQTYGGMVVAGTNFTAQLWAIGGMTDDEDALQLTENGTARFRTGGASGYLLSLGVPTVVPNAPPGTLATFQMRVWDNKGGTITNWADALTAWENGETVVGKSKLFTPPFGLGGPEAPPISLIGLESFNLYQVPPPPAPPRILEHPKTQTITIGATAYFTVRVTNSPPFFYQWLYNGEELAGETNSLLILPELKQAQSGAYSVRIENVVGATTSDPAILNVFPGLQVQMVPALAVLGEVGATYHLEFLNSVGPTNAWKSLAEVTLTNTFQYYFDTNAIGSNERVYRIAP